MRIICANRNRHSLNKEHMDLDFLSLQSNILNDNEV